MVPSMNFTLQIPRCDRRIRPRRRRSAFKSGLVVASWLFFVAGGAAVMAVSVAEIRLADVLTSSRNSANTALIAAGFGIDQVSLTGQRYTLDQDVFDALDLPNVKTFAALDTSGALKRIERISWVDTAQITRVFPGMLNVAIKERAPTAIWSRGDKSYLIDATGRTLGPVQDANGWVLPHISGEGAPADAPLLLTALSRNKDIEAHFSRAERIAERRWRVVLTNGTRIELAADREVEGLDQVATSSTLRRAVGGAPFVVDVRTAGRAVMRPLSTNVTQRMSAADGSLPMVQQP